MSDKQHEVIVIENADKFTVCPTCGYEDGFHSVFEGLRSDEAAKWMFICPKCSSKFDIGLTYPPQC